MRDKPEWLRRVQATLQEPMPFPGWRRFWIVVGVLLGAQLVKPRRGDTFYSWIDFGLMAFAFGIYAIAVQLGPPAGSVGASSEGPPSISRGIDVWMPLSLLALFLLGGIIWAILTTERPAR